MTTRENPAPPPAAPTEPKGVLADEAVPPTKPIRGYAPPIIDTAPTASSAAAPAPAPLPQLWLSFRVEGQKLRCYGALQRTHLQRVEFDPADPMVPQAYAFFVQHMITVLDGGGPLMSSAPPPRAAAAAAAEDDDDDDDAELRK